MPRDKRKNEFNIEKGTDLAAFFLYGLLKDSISNEKKNSIYNKIGMYKNIQTSEVDEVELAYGKKCKKLAIDKNRSENHVDTVNDPSHGVSEPSFNNYLQDVWNPVVDSFYEGYRELADVMKENASKIKFKSESERNFYDAMTIMAEDMASGEGWRDKMQKDSLYEFAFNSYAKFNFTSGVPSLNNAGEFNPVINKSNDKNTIEKLESTGFLDAIAGAVKTNHKMNDYMTKGSITRSELLEEYRAEEKRLKKALSLSEKEFDEINKDNAVFQNDYSDYVGSARGYTHVLDTVSAKVKLIENNWPIEDIDELAKVTRVLGNSEDYFNSKFKPNLDKKKELDAEKQAIDALPDTTLEEHQAKARRLKEYNKQMRDLKPKLEETEARLGIINNAKQVWNSIIDPDNPLESEAQRKSLLQNMKNAIDNIQNCKLVKHVSPGLNERINAPVSAASKAVMSSSPSDLLKCLDAVDPALVSSSKQFSEFKKELKKLSEMHKNLDVEDEKAVARYKKQVKKATKTGVTYLRYKRRQLEGPDAAKHKRSDLEKDRVKTVDGIINTMRLYLTPGTDERIIDSDDVTYKVVSAPKGQGMFAEYRTPPKNENEYAKYIRLHTGTGARNGTTAEMCDDLSKAIGAYACQKRRPKIDYNEKEITKYAKIAREQMDIESMKMSELREALSNPDSIKTFATVRPKKIYGLYESVNYENYVSNMRQLYQNLPEPAANDMAYKKLFESVKKVAHLPDNADGMNRDRLNETIVKSNQMIQASALEIVKKNAKSIDPKTEFALIAINTVDSFVPSKRAANAAHALINRANGVPEPKKGLFDISHPRHVDVAEIYSFDRIEDIKNDRQNDKNLRGLDQNLITNSAKTYKKTMDDARKEMTANAAAANNKKRSKEAPDRKVKNPMDTQPSGRLSI